MAYDGQPQVVIEGNTGNTTMSGILSGSGTAPLTANPLTLHGILIGGASQSVATLNPAGTSKFVLVSGGGAGPTWSTAAGVGQLVLIQSIVHSGTGPVTFTTGITSAYNNYWLRFTDCVFSVANQVLIRLSVNGGSSYIATNYLSGADTYPYNSTTGTNTNTTVGMGFCRNVNVTDMVSGSIWIYNLTSGAGYTRSLGQNVVFATTPSPSMQRTCGAYTVVNTVFNALEIINAGGGNTTGTFSLYGLVP